MTVSHRNRAMPATVAMVCDLVARDSLRLIVRGHSMEPLLDDGTMIRVRARRIYWPGDIVAFLAEDRLLVHRVLGCRPGAQGELDYVVEGDNAAAPDGPLSPRKVIGRVVAAGRPEATLSVPWRHRLAALSRFATLAWRRLLRSRLDSG